MERLFVIPYSGGCKKPGSELGAIELVRYLSFINPNKYEIIYMNEFEDVESILRMKNDVEHTLEEENKVLILGGDHSTTAYVADTILKKTEIGYIIFDAHNDYADIDSSTYNNWNVLNYITKYMKDGMVVGYREHNASMPECDRFRYYSDMVSKEVLRKALIDFCDDNPNIFISIDVDAINPVEFPGTGYPCSGGIAVREMVEYMTIIKEHAKQMIIDIVEFNPLIEKDISLLVLKRIIESVTS